MTREEGDSGRSESSSPGIRAYLTDIWELTWLPLALALVAAGVTWMVWNFTAVPCTPELADDAKCSLSTWAKFINIDLLNKMFTHGAIAGGTGGIWNYVMIRRERQRADEAERRANEAERRAEEARQRADEAERRAEEERQRHLEQIEALTERLVNRTLEQDSSG